MRVEQFLRLSADRVPDKVALIAGERRWTYSQLDGLSDELAQGLVDRGIQRGDRVVLMLDNCIEAAAAMFAVLKAGAVISPVDPATPATKLKHILNDYSAKALITHDCSIAAAADAVSTAPSIRLALVADADVVPDIGGFVHWDEVLTAPRFSLLARTRGRSFDLAMLVYAPTSADDPKGVNVTHQNIVGGATSVCEFGGHEVLAAIKYGATLVIHQ